MVQSIPRGVHTRFTSSPATHISRTDPGLVWKYDRFLWMDPGDLEVRRRSVRAIVDVTRRYDIDGVHIDDYFYPYPVNDASGRKVDFPDAETYARYVKAGGKLSKDDWRRDNVDKLVEALYKGVHAVKPWVKVGISPFGIWRPGNPPQISGFDAYSEIYADSKKWLTKRVGRLPRAAAVLADRAAAAELSRALRLVGVGELEAPAHVAGFSRLSRHGHDAAPHAGAGDHRRRSIRCARAARPRAHSLQHVGAHEEPGQPRRAAAGALCRAGAGAGVAVARSQRRRRRPTIALGRDAATNEYSLKLTPAKGDKPWLWTVRTNVAAVDTDSWLDRLPRARCLSAVGLRGAPSRGGHGASTSVARDGSYSRTERRERRDSTAVKGKR